TGSTSFGPSESLYCIARIQTDAKRVVLSWRWFPNHPSAQGRKVVDADYALRYWPTYAAGSGSNTLYVAGVRANGNTVIERWQFADPVPSVIAGQVGGHNLQPGDRLSVAVLYDEATAGRNMVAQMGIMAGSGDPRLVLRFHDSKEVWALDPGTGALALL